MTVAAIATLLAGVMLGYLGQRSRFCFVGAVRDFLLVRDTSLLKGFAAFGITAWVAFPLFRLLGGEISGTAASQLPLEVSTLAIDAVIVAMIAGLGLGIFSTLANGCPFRQHVMATQGAISSITYLFGFYFGAVVFHWLVVPAILSFL